MFGRHTGSAVLQDGITNRMRLARAQDDSIAVRLRSAKGIVFLLERNVTHNVMIVIKLRTGERRGCID